MSRFEIVHVDGGWFVRFYAANNRIVWITPGLYSRRRTAVRAIEIITGDALVSHLRVGTNGRLTAVLGDCVVDVRDVDERGAS